MVKILVIVIQERNINFLQIANLAPSFSGNDVICVEGTEQIIHARFCYGPMDLVALSRENISAYIRPTGVIGSWSKQMLLILMAKLHLRFIYLPFSIVIPLFFQVVHK